MFECFVMEILYALLMAIMFFLVSKGFVSGSYVLRFIFIYSIISAITTGLRLLKNKRLAR